MKKIALMGLATIVSTTAMADVKFYGTLKGDFVNSEKMTNDAQPVFVTEKGTGYSDFDKTAHKTMSFRETLIGANFSNGSKLNGTLEIDFNGEDENTASVNRSNSGVMRFRQAFLTYAVSDKGTVNFGKKWAAFQGVNPHTMSNNLYGFYQGNTGFISDILNYVHDFGALDLTVELGASDTGTGNGTSANSAKTNKVSNPSQTVRLDYKLDNHHFGIAHTIAEKNTKDALGTSDNISIQASKFFYQGNFDQTEVRAEYAMGKNAAGHGWLTKNQANGFGSVASGGDDIEETAMWLSANHDFGAWNLFARYGVAEITNAKDVVKETASADRISKNAATALGASFDVDENVQTFIEYTMVTTDRITTIGAKDTESDAGSVINLGMQYTF